MNDSLRTDVFVRYNPETIACACIYLSARQLGIVLPRRPAWYLLFSCQEPHLKDICIRILKLYTRPKPNADELNRIVTQLEQAYQQSRHRSKHATNDAGSLTPTVNDGVSSLSPNVTTLAAALADHKVVSTESAGSTPSIAKGDEKGGNHVSKKSMKTGESPGRGGSRSRSVSPGDKQQQQQGQLNDGKDRRHKSSRHHHHHRKKNRSRSRSRTRSRSRSVDKGRRSGAGGGGGGGGDRDRDRDREKERGEKKKRDSTVGDGRHESRDRDKRDKDREKERGDYKYRKNKDRDKDVKERRHRDRSLSRDRRR